MGVVQQLGWGGISLFGISLGGDGGGSSSYNHHTIDTQAQTVTFKDDPTVCRLLGVKVTQLPVDVTLEHILSGARPLREIPSLLALATRLAVNGLLPDREVILRGAGGTSSGGSNN
jgi:hypothetical protein